MKRIIHKTSIGIITAIILFCGVCYFLKLPVYARNELCLGLTLHDGDIFTAGDPSGNYQVLILDYTGVSLKGQYRVSIAGYIYFDSLSGERCQYFSTRGYPTGFRITKGRGTNEDPFIAEVLYDYDRDIPGSLPPEEENEPKNIEDADYLEPLRTALHIAGEQTDATSVEYTADYALPAEFMQYLIDHKNITLIYTVTYDGAEHTVTIPAGTAKVEDGVEYYGPAWLIATYGEKSAINPSGTYTVQSGDTLSGIAKMFFTTPDALAKKNHLSNPDLIVTGQTLQY